MVTQTQLRAVVRAAERGREAGKKYLETPTEEERQRYAGRAGVEQLERASRTGFISGRVLEQERKQQKRVAESRRLQKQRDSQRIAKELGEKQLEIQNRYNQKLRGATSKQERLDLLQKRGQEIVQSQVDARLERVRTGIVTATKTDLIGDKAITREDLLQRETPQQIQEPKQRELLKFKDIDWGGTFTGKGEIEKQAQSYVEQQLRRGSGYLGEKVLKVIPEGKIKDVLSKEIDYRHTDLLKFAAFSPLMQTGAVKKGTAKVKVKPKEKITFKEAKQIIKAMRKEQLKVFTKTELQKIIKNPALTDAEKQLAAQRLAATIIEAKTGTPIITESGAIDLAAIESLRAIPDKKIVIDVVFEQIPQMRNVGSVVTGASILTTQEKFNLFESPTNILEPQEKIKAKQKSGLTQEARQKQSPVFVSKYKMGQESVLKEKQKYKQKQKLSQRFLFQQKQLQMKKQIQRQKLRLKLIKPTPPKTIFKIPIPKSSSTIIPVPKTIKKVPTKDGFKVYVRRYGKWILIGESKTKTGALKLGQEKVISTLAASFKITKGKKPIRVPITSGMFRPAKREKGVIVQRAPYRIKTGTEISEILKIRKGGQKWW